jgi:hypothetical protein
MNKTPEPTFEYYNFDRLRVYILFNYIHQVSTTTT